MDIPYNFYYIHYIYSLLNHILFYIIYIYYLLHKNHNFKSNIIFLYIIHFKVNNFLYIRHIFQYNHHMLNKEDFYFNKVHYIFHQKAFYLKDIINNYQVHYHTLHKASNILYIHHYIKHNHLYRSYKDLYQYMFYNFIYI